VPSKVLPKGVGIVWVGCGFFVVLPLSWANT
jgi:hypothetical protein